MSSWLANLANSLGVDDDDDDDDEEEIKNKNQSSSPQKQQSPKQNQHTDNAETSEVPGRGVKEDLSELTKTLTRQLWGVASFLAPPPSVPPPPPPPRSHSISDWNRWDSTDPSVSSEISDSEISDTSRISGIRNDFAEIGGRFKNEISRLSNHKAVSEFSKIASGFLPFGSEGGEYEDVVGSAVGVTKEVLAFARNISMHPETWLDFPLSDDEDSDDFDMSDAQQEHALAVERLAPRLAALRIEICPGYMSEGCFWKIYFVLLHPRLNKHDAELLSTPQIVEARALLTQDLQNRSKAQESARATSFGNESSYSLKEDQYPSSDVPSENTPLKTFACDTDIETEKHPVVSTEMQIVDKSVVEEDPAHKNKDISVTSSSKFSNQKYEDEDDGDGDDWPDDESTDMGGYSGANVPLGNEEDVSFSDLEDDDDKAAPTSSKAVRSGKESRDWVHADDDIKDSNDWLNVDEVDVV